MRDFGGGDLAGLAGSLERLLHGAQLPERLGRHDVGLRRAQRVDAGAAGGAALRRQRVGVVPVGRGHRNEADARGGPVEVTGGPGVAAVLTDPGIDDAGLVQPAAGLAHPLDPVVHRVVVGAGDQVEAERAQVPDDRGRRGERPVVAARIRLARKATEVDRRRLEVAVGGVGVPEDLDDRGEIRIGGQGLRERMRRDQVADGGERESIGHARLELARGRAPGVEGRGRGRGRGSLRPGGRRDREGENEGREDGLPTSCLHAVLLVRLAADRIAPSPDLVLLD